MGQQTNYRVLIIGDRGERSDALAGIMHEAGFASVGCGGGREGLDLLRHGAPDLVAIEMPLAHEDGLALCRAIRAESDVPLIVFDGSRADQACIDALDAGADDYMTATSSAPELAARVRAVIRRSNAEPYRCGPSTGRRGSEQDGILQVGDVRLELTTCRVAVNGRVTTLTPNEFRLMAVFLRAPGEVFTREDLRRRVWPDDQHSLHLVEVHIANLRAKIESDPHHPGYIVTVRSRGYKFSNP